MTFRPLRPALALALVLGLAAPALADPTADTISDEHALAALVWAHNPDVRQAVAAEASARADAMRAAAWTNPGMSIGFGSVPFNARSAANPGDQAFDVDLAHAPSYALDVTQPVDLWRRPLRQQRAETGRALASWQTRDLYKQRTADLLATAVRLSAARLRMALLDRQLAELDETARLVALSAREGMSAPLEHEKIAIEQGRTQVLVDQARIAYDAARADWNRLVLVAPPELTAAEAQAAIDRLATLPPRWPEVDGRLAGVPQRQVLALQADQAAADLEIARRGWLPDLELHVGYTRSTLEGSVPDSLQGGFNLTFPVWERGEADAVDARGRADAAALAGTALERTVAQQSVALRDRARVLAALNDRLRQRLAAARGTLGRLEGALKAHGIPLSDVIQVRRTVLDLEGDRVDLLEQLSNTLIDYRRLTGWRLPDPEGAQP